jgi:hypothetical protein
MSENADTHPGTEAPPASPAGQGSCRRHANQTRYLRARLSLTANIAGGEGAHSHAGQVHHRQKPMRPPQPDGAKKCEGPDLDCAADASDLCGWRTSSLAAAAGGGTAFVMHCRPGLTFGPDPQKYKAPLTSL